jgi:hypothetical protein
MLTDKPEAIMINVPDAFFKHDGKIKGDREEHFRRFYECMGTGELPEDSCFYHFISTVPVHEVTTVFVCFKGHIQYKAIVVQFLKKQPVMLKDYQHPEPRNWCVTTGPVVKAPEGMLQKGFRGFRYCKMLF